MNGLFPQSLAAMPGDDLLFQRLSVSTIGAVRFHGRVRDGIGWVTDAMATKQWSQRKGFNRCVLFDERLASKILTIIDSRAVVDGVEFSSANRTIRTG